MVDTVTTPMGNLNDDWEVAVDTGEFDKRLEPASEDGTGHATSKNRLPDELDQFS